MRIGTEHSHQRQHTYMYCGMYRGPAYPIRGSVVPPLTTHSMQAFQANVTAVFSSLVERLGQTLIPSLLPEDSPKIVDICLDMIDTLTQLLHILVHTFSPDAGAPLDSPENMALFKEVIFAGRWLPLVPCWRAVRTQQHTEHSRRNSSSVDVEQSYA